MNDTKIVLPHGGYSKLICFKKSEVVYQGTVVFCRRFLPSHGDRTVDQMTQAARSCKQNLAEGSAASGTSKETEMKLTGVARATLDELLEDYRDFLRSHGLEEWGSKHPRRIKLRDWSKEHNEWKDWSVLSEILDAESFANAMITVTSQTRWLIERLMSSLESDFEKHGGIRERMHAVRTKARSESWNASIESRLTGAMNAQELDFRVRCIIDETHHCADRIRKRNGW